MLTWPNILFPVAGLMVVGVVGFVCWARRGPAGEPVTVLLWLATRVYGRLMHRTTYTGLEHVPVTNKPGGFIVVSNHTGPIDPILIQAACRFEIRWMMAADMMIPALNWLWKRHRMIPVARDGRDSGPAREAIRHVREGGCIGVFPEGAIVQPRGEVRPFQHGVGLIIKRTRAPVLLLWITGTPESPHLGPALRSRSRSHVVFIDRLEFAEGTDAATITRTLRERLVQASGWPVNDEPLVPPQRKGNAMATA